MTDSFNIRHALNGFLFLSALLWALPSHGQQWRWAKQMTGNDNSFSSAKPDPSGNHYVTGIFSDSARFDNRLLVSRGGRDAFVAKTDSTGHYLWIQTLRGTAEEQLHVIAPDTLGHLYVSGYTSANATLGTTAIAGPTYFIARLSAQTGAIERVTLTPAYANVASKPDGTLYLTGEFNTNTLQFGSIQITNTNIALPVFQTDDVYVAALSNTGTWLWALAGGGEGGQRAHQIAVSSTGNLVIAGDYVGSVSGVDTLRFGSSSMLCTYGIAQTFLAGVTASGMWQWVRDLASDDRVTPDAIALDSLDNIYLTGSFNGFHLQANGDTLINHLSFTMSNVGFIAKFTPTGHGLWAIPTGSDNKGTALEIAGNQHFYVAGFATADSIDIGGISLNSIRGLTYLAALDSAGHAHWIEPFGSKTSSFPSGLVLDAAQRLTVCGGFNESAVFPPFRLTIRDSTNSDYNGFLAQLITPPFIHRFGPSSGPAGTVVRISGVGFAGATAVMFGTIPATSFTVLPDGSIQATVPPGVSTLGVVIKVVGVGGTGQSVGVFGRGPQGIASEAQAATFELWPNPAHSLLHLRARDGQALGAVTVRDAVGRVVRHYAGGTAPTADLTLSGLPAGLYVVQSGATTRRLVVE